MGKQVEMDTESAVRRLCFGRREQISLIPDGVGSCIMLGLQEKHEYMSQYCTLNPIGLRI